MKSTIAKPFSLVIVVAAAVALPPLAAAATNGDAVVPYKNSGTGCRIDRPEDAAGANAFPR